MKTLQSKKEAKKLLEKMLRRNDLKNAEVFFRHLISKNFLTKLEIEEINFFFFYLTKKYENAYSVGKALENRIDQSGIFLNLMGVIAKKLKMYDTAIIYFERAIAKSLLLTKKTISENKILEFKENVVINISSNQKYMITDENIKVLENLLEVHIELHNTELVSSILNKLYINDAPDTVSSPVWKVLYDFGVGQTLASKRQALEYSQIDSVYRLLLKIGDFYLKDGNHIFAKNCFLAASELKPTLYPAYFLCGVIYLHQQNLSEARRYFELALRFSPNNPKILLNLGIAFHGLKNVSNSLYLFSLASEIDITLESAYLNIGNILSDYEKYSHAELFFLKVIELNKTSLNGHNNLGKCLAKQRRYAEAIDAFNNSLAINPKQTDTHWNKALSEISLGNFLDGWKNYDSRINRPEFKVTEIAQKPLFPIESIRESRSILVISEQGYGDIIQMSRFVYLLSHNFETIFFKVPHLLKRLFNFSNHVQIVSASPNSEDYDGVIFASSLPHFCGINSSNIPQYHNVFNSEIYDDAANFATGLSVAAQNIGIAWFGNPKYSADFYRSIDFEFLKPLLKLKVIWHSLQVNYRLQDRLSEVTGAVIIDHAEHLKDFKDTAILINKLDLVICVDTAVAHLSGALGKRTFLLLPQICDYRWALHDTTTPWYESVTIFRQKVQGDWVSVIDEVTERLTYELPNIDTR